MLTGQQLLDALQAMPAARRAKPVFVSAGSDENGNALFLPLEEITPATSALGPDHDAFGSGIKPGDTILLYNDPDPEPYQFGEDAESNIHG